MQFKLISHLYYKKIGLLKNLLFYYIYTLSDNKQAPTHRHTSVPVHVRSMICRRMTTKNPNISNNKPHRKEAVQGHLEMVKQGIDPEKKNKHITKKELQLEIKN
jgi:hypothetical protein